MNAHTPTFVIRGEKCPLRFDWIAWSQDKRQDRLFMSCPLCKAYGSHIEEAK